MVSKILIGTGALLLFYSLFTILPVIFSLFQTLVKNEQAGIGSFGFSIFDLLLLIFGFVLIAIGTALFFKHKTKT